MPYNDFQCPACGAVEEYRYYPMPRYDDQHNRVDPWPPCTACGGALELIPAMQHDLLPESFIVDLGDGPPRRISSLQELRTIENESLRKTANGDGVPLIFRDFSQNHSNRSVNTLAGTPYEKNKALPRPKRQTRSGLPITVSPISPE